MVLGVPRTPLKNMSLSGNLTFSLTIFFIAYCIAYCIGYCIAYWIAYCAPLLDCLYFSKFPKI